MDVKEIFKGKTNGSWYLAELINFDEEFVLRARLGVDETGPAVGDYSLYPVEVVKLGLKKHYDLKRIERISKGKVWRGNITVSEEQENQGIAGVLLKLSVEELEKRGGIHVARFSSLGLKKVMPFLYRRGYEMIEPKPSSSYGPLLWKDYSI